MPMLTPETRRPEYRCKRTNMETPGHAAITSLEQAAVQKIVDGITALALFLQENPPSSDSGPELLYEYLNRMKQIQGNTSNGVSLVACVLAKWSSQDLVDSISTPRRRLTD